MIDGRIPRAPHKKTCLPRTPLSVYSILPALACVPNTFVCVTLSGIIPGLVPPLAWRTLTQRWRSQTNLPFVGSSPVARFLPPHIGRSVYNNLFGVVAVVGSVCVSYPFSNHKPHKVVKYLVLLTGCRLRNQISLTYTRCRRMHITFSPCPLVVQLQEHLDQALDICLVQLDTLSRCHL